MKQCVKLDGSSACSPSAEESAIMASIVQDGVQNGLQKAEKGGGVAVLDDACISCDLRPLIGLQVPCTWCNMGGSCQAILSPSLEKGISLSHWRLVITVPPTDKALCPTSSQVEIIRWTWMAEPSRRWSRNPRTIDVITVYRTGKVSRL